MTQHLAPDWFVGGSAATVPDAVVAVYATRGGPDHGDPARGDRDPARPDHPRAPGPLTSAWTTHERPDHHRAAAGAGASASSPS